MQVIPKRFKRLIHALEGHTEIYVLLLNYQCFIYSFLNLLKRNLLYNCQYDNRIDMLIRRCQIYIINEIN